MVTVALAGASTGFGRTMLQVFIQHNTDRKHRLVLLSRSPQPEFTAKGVDVRPVDYNNHQELVNALNDVHTVLSVIGGDGNAIKSAQLALISACQEAGVKRFAPSEYAGTDNENIDLYAPKKEVWEATRKSGLEYTRFSCGLFTSAFATGTPKPMTAVGEREGCKSGEEEALAGLRPWTFVVNMRAGTADYPGDGTAPLAFTDMRDVAYFVFRALDMEKWPEHLGIRGDAKSFKDAVEISEKVQGRKWLTKDNSIEDMQAQMEADSSVKFYNQVRIAMAKGWGLVGDELNREFPDVKPVTCEEFIEKWWSGVELGEPSWTTTQTFM